MTIKSKLISIVIVALAGFAAIYGTVVVGDRYASSAERAKEECNEAEVRMLLARRAEKDFLARRDPAYVKKVEAALNEMRESLKGIANEREEFRKLADDVADKSQLYGQAFQKVADGVKALGYTEKDGLQGTLRNAVHEIESIIGKYQDDKLKADMLMLRRREKDFMLRGDWKYVESLHADAKKMETSIQDALSVDDAAKTTMLNLLKEYVTAFDGYAAGYKALGQDMDGMRAHIQATEPLLEELTTRIGAHAAQVDRTVSIFMASIVAAAALLLAGALGLISRGILRSLESLRDCSLRVTKGELDACGKIAFTGELEAVRQDIATMVDKLNMSMAEAQAKGEEAGRQAAAAKKAMAEAHAEKERVDGMLETMKRVAADASEIADHLVSTSTELTAQAEEISRGAQVQSDRVHETATAMEQMNATVMEVARNASEAAEGADAAQKKATEGASTVKAVVEATEVVRTQTQDLTEGLGELGRRAEAIGRIMDVITDIADQTNLLALNAAIEAARAGDAGRGFAVVADEVRKLAEKTMSATKEVGDAIGGIQDGAAKSISVMGEATRSVERNSELTSTAGRILEEIVAIISNTADQVHSIATAAEEQSATSEQINSSTEEINRISAQTSESVAQSTHEIREVADLAEKLRKLVRELNM